MKAILVIDVDEKYLGKEISLVKFTDDNAIYCSAELKPVPKRQNSKMDHSKYTSDYFFELSILKAMDEGYNDCIDEILKGEE